MVETEPRTLEKETGKSGYGDQLRAIEARQKEY